MKKIKNKNTDQYPAILIEQAYSMRDYIKSYKERHLLVGNIGQSRAYKIVQSSPLEWQIAVQNFIHLACKRS